MYTKNIQSENGGKDYNYGHMFTIYIIGYQNSN